MKPVLPNRTHLLRTLAIVAGLGVLSGCTTVRGWFSNDDKKAGEPAALVEFSPSVAISPLWSANVGKGEGRLGLRQGPVVDGGRVYAAAVTGGIRALDLQTGRQLWQVPSDIRLSGGPGAGDGLVVVGGLDGEVLALDAQTGAERWQAKVENEVIAAPTIGMGMVFVRSNDGRVTALDASNGQRRWFWNRDVPSLSVRGNDAVLLGPGYVFVGNDDGSLSALSATDGRPLWEQVVGAQEGRTELDRMADVDGTPVLDGAAIYATSFKRQTLAIDGPTGRPMWASEQGGAGRIGLAPDRLVVSSPDGTVYALDKTRGSALWQQPGLARRNLTAPGVHGDYAVVGDMEGYLHWLNLQTGEFAARTRVSRAALRAAPVVVDGVLLAQDTNGRVAAYRLAQ